MSENKKNVNPSPELSDETLDQVSGGRGTTNSGTIRCRDASGDERWKNPTAPDLQYECIGCGNWTRGSELATNGSKCRICKMPIDKNTARWEICG